MSGYRVRLVAVLAMVFATILCYPQDASASTVAGRVLYKSGQPIPGLTVYLVHPNVGRSAPASTDSEGRFSIANVPQVAEPFYLEVYWGRTLKYRKTLVVSAPRVVVPDIAL
jgi:hypothetical protein